VTSRLATLRTSLLLRNSSALILTTALTSVLGLGFWAVAARHYSVATVGRASALLAAATLIGGFAQLNLSAILVRFLPTSGVATRRFISGSYALSCGLAVALAVGFAELGLGHRYLGSSALQVALFAGSVVLLLLFALQDAVLTGLRAAPVVLGENFAFAVLKLVLLLALAARLSGTGIIVSWMGPVAIAVLGVGVYLFVAAVPAHERAAAGASELPGVRRLSGLVAAEYLKSLLSNVTSLALPLLVAARLGLVYTAYFSIPWLINGAIMSSFDSIAAAFVVESAFDRNRWRHMLRQVLLLGGTVVVIGTTIELAGAHVILEVVGRRYAAHGAGLMRLLALGIPFNALYSLYAIFVWMEQKLWRLVALEAVSTVVMLGPSALLLTRIGLPAIGWAAFGSSVILGLVSVPAILRRVRGPDGSDQPAAAPATD
jgi:O-antigen/teichoic acid export membrane protein